MVEQRAEEICGNCQFFDYNYVDGEPVGARQMPGLGLVAFGLCRKNCGLQFRSIPKVSTCRHYPSEFAPKKPLDSTASPTPVLTNISDRLAA